MSASELDTATIRLRLRLLEHQLRVTHAREELIRQCRMQWPVYIDVDFAAAQLTSARALMLKTEAELARAEGRQ